MTNDKRTSFSKTEGESNYTGTDSTSFLHDFTYVFHFINLDLRPEGLMAC